METAAAGINFEHSFPNLLDLRFADNSALFGRNADEMLLVFGSLTEAPAEVRLLFLIFEKRKKMTNKTQPPTHLHAQNQARIQVQAASRAFFAHKQQVCDQRVRVKDRLRFFDVVITPVAMSRSGHRTIYQSGLCHTDVLFRFIPQAASNGGGSSAHSELVSSLARDFARA